MFRIGNGFDVHRLQEGLPFRLGGLLIPCNKGCVAHSDGDVLIHAICDALLGAAALGDIGVHFPDTDAVYKNIDSKILLEKTAALVRAAGYTVNNIDTIVCLEKPKINSYILSMREMLAKILAVPVEQISIKATTCERLGFVGREEGVAAYAVTLLQR
ncbi:MAG: 2-C-methyl-D-erythritol 2,4-cyclodiphosphate synthase [Prevotellaceae bacterium]|jgi:2-C-methyl-D-erythritol 2,4-cyclodiphosphate synthase|nr:2-C-methyl-D-erythritol 2,4-cyclodiphosphate synthase [Prevotellaceae bacterium]